MKIRSMTATFGKLDHARLELGDGLNLIYAPNEGGKSTWAAFWKAMLYGIDTRDRDKKGYLADKNRYQPWSGAPMESNTSLTSSREFFFLVHMGMRSKYSSACPIIKIHSFLKACLPDRLL